MRNFAIFILVLFTSLVALNSIESKLNPLLYEIDLTIKKVKEILPKLPETYLKKKLSDGVQKLEQLEDEYHGTGSVYLKKRISFSLEDLKRTYFEAEKLIGDSVVPDPLNELIKSMMREAEKILPKLSKSKLKERISNEIKIIGQLDDQYELEPSTYMKKRIFSLLQDLEQKFQEAKELVESSY